MRIVPLSSIQTVLLPRDVYSNIPVLPPWKQATVLEREDPSVLLGVSSLEKFKFQNIQNFTAGSDSASFFWSMVLSTYSVMITIVFIPHCMDPNQEDILIHCMLKALLFHRCVIIYFYFQVQTEEHAVDSGAFRHLVLKHHCCIQRFCGLHCIHVLIYVLNKVLKLEYNIKHQKFKE